MRLIWICLGGACGTGARYLLSSWVLRQLGPGFPYGTLAVNLIGSLLLGVVMHLGLTTQTISPELRLVLGTGVLGGFTTYSTFNYETLQYLEEGAWLLGALNVAATLLLCLLGGVCGVACARWAVGR